MIQLRSKELDKLAVITQISLSDINKLAAMSLLNDALVVDLLILYDFKKLKKDKRKYTTTQITEAIMEEYQVSRTKVHSAIYRKKKTLYHCSVCGRRIPKSEHKRNEGVCEKCTIKSIQL